MRFGFLLLFLLGSYISVDARIASDSLRGTGRVEEARSHLETGRMKAAKKAIAGAEQKADLLNDQTQKPQQAQVTTQDWLIVVSGLVIVVTLFFMVILYRSNKERQRVNKELEVQRNRLEELIRVKDKMLVILSHDLRSPLASVKGMLYLFREGDLSPQERRNQAIELEVTVDQNLSMMDNLLTWTHQQMSGMRVDIESVNAYQITESVLINHRLQAKEKGVALINRVSDDLLVQADPNLLHLILRNLISNSIKFSQEGDEVKIQAREIDSGRVIFEVQDTGIGIPKEKQNALFSMDGESRLGTQSEKGSGLGLKLCKEFVEKQSGEIHFESTEGKGTTFTFSLPKL